MKKTEKKAIFGSKVVNVAPVVRTVYLNEDGEEVLVMNGCQYKIADLEKNEKVYLLICTE